MARIRHTVRGSSKDMVPLARSSRSPHQINPIIAVAQVFRWGRNRQALCSTSHGTVPIAC